MDRFGEREYFEYTRPLPVEGGITARSRRGSIGETWWSQRFIELLESFGVGSRLERGRRYARAGQVVELDVEAGIVLAKVQGSRYTPYKVRIRTKVLSDTQWRRAEKAMAGQALPLAELLAGEMPRDIEDVFAACKLTLFPRSNADLKATCSCPDAMNPCKHIAAVYYLLAEHFDEHPFLIFAWRGRTQQELLDTLRARRRRASPERPHPAPSAAPAPTAAEPAALPAGLEGFWQAGPGLADLWVSPLASEMPDLLLRELGPAPIECDGVNLSELLTPAYTVLAQAAERRALR
ncbi:MAG TPA: SWIM zinc finger family protein [Solirubrobacteraceae bacterium]|jgi:uncharacterized Zn finger protein|nr:SWIM zinc finger family protein [Solirubrobacteraceae bacterium]